MNFLNFWLVPWATLACSLFATVVLWWLGCLVLLAAPRVGEGKSRESWFAGIGLLLVGSACAAHTALLDYPIEKLMDSVGLWWKWAWLAMIAVPGIWCALALWYAGWSHQTARLRLAVWGCALCGIFATGTALFSDARRFAAGFAALDADSLSGALLLLPISYALYLLLCIAIALAVLRRAPQSGRVLRDLARQRARPFLLAATVALGLGAANVLAAFGWAIWLALRNPELGTINQVLRFGDALEMLVALLLGVAVACVGKAVVSFEIFSRRTLPRATVAGSWRLASYSFALWSVVVALLLGIEIARVYTLLASALALALIAAWMTVRLDCARQMLAASWSEMIGAAHGETAGEDALSALGAMLDARQMELQTFGAASVLVPEILRAPHDAKETARTLTIENWHRDEICIPPQSANDAWTVPLWNPELSGVLLVWPRRADALFTEDAMELARAAGTRILETRVAAALSRQLIEVQKRAARSSAALDDTVALGGRTRRLLHDEVLPRLHASILAPEANETRMALAEAHKMVSDILRDAPANSADELEKYGLWNALERAVNAEFDRTPSAISWHIEDAARAAKLLPTREETLFHAAREVARNARRYAVSQDEIKIEIGARVVGANLEIAMADNGPGLGARVPSQGSGQGLALHAALLAVAGGSLVAQDCTHNNGTRVILTVPLGKTK